MALSERSTIILQLGEDMKKITSLNKYNSDLKEIVLGMPTFSYFTQRPAVTYWMFRDDKETDTHGNGETFKWLNFIIRGYVDDSVKNGYRNILNLADDIENFIYSDHWTYTDETETGSMLIVPADIDKGRAELDYRIRVAYYRGCATF